MCAYVRTYVRTVCIIDEIFKTVCVSYVHTYTVYCMYVPMYVCMYMYTKYTVNVCLIPYLMAIAVRGMSRPAMVGKGMEVFGS